MKHIATVLIVAAAVSAPTMLSATEYVSPEGLIYNVAASGTTAVFTGISESKKETLTHLVIPATINYGGKEVTVVGVGDNSCYGNPYITKLEIGSGVERIGASAFGYCSGLSSVSFSEGLREIGSLSFYSCTSLPAVEFPASVTTIEDFAFFYLTKLQTVKIPAGVDKLGASPFGDCPALQSIEVDSDNKNYASLDGVLFTKDMTRLVNYPIGDGKTSYTMPASVTVIGANSMRNNKVMTSISLSPALTTIEAGAFNYCAVRSFVIPAGVSSIGSQAFSGNENLEEFIVDASNPWLCSEGGMLLTKDKKRLLFGISKATIDIPEGVVEICEGAFYRYPTVRTVNISSTVKEIGQSAFSTCASLTRINFSTGVEVIGLQAFYKCTAMRNLTIAGSIRDIGSACFALCTQLREVTIEEGVQFVDASCFQGCTALEKINIPASMKDVGEAMLYGCMNLSQCDLAEGVERIGASAFSSCINLKSITLPSTLREIGNYAFNSSGLESLVLPEGVEEIGEGAFENCIFPEVTLPGSVRSIGNLSFAWNPELTSFTSGKGLREMGSYALLSSDKLEKVMLQEGLATIGACAFGSCPSLEKLALPASVETVGSQAFAQASGLKELTVLAPVPPTAEGSLFDNYFDGYSVVELMVPADSYGVYKIAKEWNKFSKIGKVDGIESVSLPEPTIVEIYDASGLHRPALGDGLNIIRMSDGTVRKQIGK